MTSVSPFSACSPRLWAAAAALALAACSTPVKLSEAPVETRSGTPADAVGAKESSSAAAAATSAPAPQSTVATVQAGQGGDVAGTGWPAQRVVYFDFDSFTLRDDAKPVIEGHAKVLVAQKARKLTIEGHTDDRGGREYNLALGQKRAEAVLRSLVLLGAAESQLEAVSFGKERPAAEGGDEAAWAKNRRAELKERR